MSEAKTVFSVDRSYHDESRQLRMCLIKILASPFLGRRSWHETLRVGEALIRLQEQADSMDKEAKLGRFSECDAAQCVSQMTPHTDRRG